MERIDIDPMRKKAILHYQEIAHRMPKYSPTKMAELAPGVVAVEDHAGECDALFDVEKWKFTRPKLWGEETSETLLRAGMRVLEGVGRIPQVSTIEQMARFARAELTPIGKITWHNTPEFFTPN